MQNINKTNNQKNPKQGFDYTNISSTQYITANIGENIICIPIHQVIEVFKPDIISDVPCCHKFIDGIVARHGQTTTIINLSRLLFNKDLYKEEIMLLDTNYRHESFGLKIDNLGKVIEINQSHKITKVPSANYDIVLIKSKNDPAKSRPLAVIDTSKLLAPFFI